MLRLIQYAFAVKSAHRHRFARLTKPNRRYEVGVQLVQVVQLVPQHYFLLGGAPNPQLAVQAAAHKVAIIFGMKANRRDNRGVTKRAQAFIFVDVPETARFVG